jgi:hypothetical protein
MRRWLQLSVLVTVLLAGCSSARSQMEASLAESASRSDSGNTPLELLASNPGFEHYETRADTVPDLVTLLADEVNRVPTATTEGFPTAEYRFVCGERTMAQVYIFMPHPEAVFFGWEENPDSWKVGAEVNPDPSVGFTAPHRDAGDAPRAFAHEWSYTYPDMTHTGAAFATRVPIDGATEQALVLVSSAKTWQGELASFLDPETVINTEPYTEPIDCAHDAWRAAGFEFPRE